VFLSSFDARAGLGVRVPSSRDETGAGGGGFDFTEVIFGVIS